MTLRFALWMALSIAVVNGFARFAYALILPAMRDSLAWDYAATGWLNTANSLGYALGGLLGMFLLKRVAAKHLFLSGLIATVVTIGLVGLTNAMDWMLLWRFLAGIGAAWVFSCGGALVAEMYSNDSNKAGSAIAIFYAGGGFGMALSGLLVYPVLTGGISWQLAWIILCAAGFALALMPSLSSIQLSLSARPVAMAQHTALPIRQMSQVILAYFLFGVGYIVYLTFVVAWLKELKVPTTWSAGLWVAMGLAVMASGWLWRKPMAQWWPMKVFAVAALCNSIGAMMPLVVRNDAGLLASVLLVGGSFFMVPAAVVAYNRKTLPQAQWARAMSFYTCLFAIGQAIGPVFAGWMADTLSMNAAMLMGGLVLCLSAGIAFLQRPNFQ